MKYQKDTYEDEIDRMRLRKQEGRRRTASRKRDASYEDFEIIEDLQDLGNHQRRAKKGQLSKRHKRRRKKKWLWGIVLLAVLLAGSLFWKEFKNHGYWTVVVYGVDSRDGNLGKGALADVQILCSINRKTGEIRLASVFRDTYLKIDSEGTYHKINEAYFRGGREQAGEALKENLDLNIEDYATFNWKAVVDAINVLGGIDLEITDREFAYINAFITETVNSTGVGSYQLEHSGMNHLDGVQAVAYARLRLMDTDFNRTERQRKVLGLAMEKAKKADLNTLRVLIGTVFPQISTSIGVDDLMLMAKDARKYYIGQTTGFPFSHTEMRIEKRDCVVPTTLESNVIQLHGFLYDDPNFSPSGVVQKISAHIAEISGIDTPGKDTESGKNIGAEGKSGENQNAPVTPAPEGPAPTEESAETAPSESSEEANTAESPDTEPETTIGDFHESSAAINESSEEVSPTTDGSIPTNPSQGPVAAPGSSGTDHPDIQGPGANGPGSGGPASNGSNGSEASEHQSNAALEAPGQGKETVGGPGV